jgi:hypothetical protein
MAVSSRNRIFLISFIVTISRLGHCAATDDQTWHFKREFLSSLVRSIPTILRGQDKTTGRFGTGIWLPSDQSVIYPLAAAWAINDPANQFYHDQQLLDVIMASGDTLIGAQDKQGQWEFRKKDNSTWGKHYDPWVYSRWVRTFAVISSAMPPERRQRWQKALELGYTGIAKRELSRVHNIPSHHAMGLYIAGKALTHPEWSEQAAAFLVRVTEAQDPAGFWSEHVGPVVHYDSVYIDALGTYYGITHDKRVLPALERAATFHANFTYPDGTEIETVDERNPYLNTKRLPVVGCAFSSEGRAYVQAQWKRLQAADTAAAVDTLASFLLYGEEGPIAKSSANSTFTAKDLKACVTRAGPWCASISAYASPISTSRWIQDRQNFVSVFNERTGLILGGGNTKLQPLWSSFTIGNPALLSHKSGDQNPNFSEPAGLTHVPSNATLAPTGMAVSLDYNSSRCGIQLALTDTNKAQVSYSVDKISGNAPIEAHVTLLPSLGKSWRTAARIMGEIRGDAIKLQTEELGGWFEDNGWRIEVPAGSTLSWPVLPHNPYRKDGHAELSEGRIIITLHFSETCRTNTVAITVPAS